MVWNLLVILGIIILAASLWPVRRLIALVPSSTLRNYWRTLMGLTALFITGYIAYAAFFWQHHLENDLHDFIVPVVFFFGSAFVWFTCTLFLRTTTDLRRMALLEEQNITDPLIGIYNRRYLDRRLEAEISRARRYGHPLSILMIDIDRFKKVNDLYGHKAGDLALNYMGKLILNAVRNLDVVARYGGEEIVIIAPDITESAAGKLAERLREHVAEHELVLASESSSQRSVHLTISVGVAELSDKVESVDELIECADRALYLAKERGRNRIGFYSSIAARMEG